MAAPRLEVINNAGKTKKAVFDSIKKFSLERLNDLIRVLMDNIDDTLFELSDKVDNDAQRNMYFESMREVRLKREGIKQNFDFELHELFDRFVGAKSDAESSDDEEELTLVEFDDLEDDIAVKNMVSRARSQFEDDLFAVVARLNILLEREDISADDNPFDPRSICDSFHKAADILETDIQVKLIFYKMFEKYVITNLGDFYHEINCQLIQNDVLPEFRAEQERMKQTSKFMAEHRKSTQRPEPAKPDNEVSAAVNEDARVDDSEDPVELSLLDTLTKALPEKSRNRTSGKQESQGTEVKSTNNEDNTTKEELMDTLTQIQTKDLPKRPAAQTDPQTQWTETQQQIEKVREASKKQADGADNQVIEVVSMLFDYFFEDEALPAPVKVLVGRLQVPIIKVAILDKEFFNQRNHPARKLLDSISQASLGWGGNHDDHQPLIAKIEKTVDFLLKEFEDDIQAFDYALADFQQFLQQEEDKVRHASAALAQREQKREQRVQATRKVVDALIKKITHGRGLSKEVLNFIETTWYKVLLKAHLSLGGSSNHWKYLQRISATLVWTLVPKKNETERAKVIKTIPSLLRALSKSMDLIKIDTKTQNLVFQMLAKEHAKIVKQKSKDVVTRVDDRTVWPEEGAAAALAKATEQIVRERARKNENVELFSDDSVTVISAAPTDNVIDDLNSFTAGVKSGKIQIKDEIVLGTGDDSDFDDPVDPTPPINDQAQRWARKIEIGTWLEFKEPKAKKLVARLSWRSNVTGNLVFVNRQGQKVKNLTTQALAAEMRAERVKEIDSASVFDRAIGTIMGRSKS